MQAPKRCGAVTNPDAVLGDRAPWYTLCLAQEALRCAEIAESKHGKRTRRDVLKY